MGSRTAVHTELSRRTGILARRVRTAALVLALAMASIPCPLGAADAAGQPPQVASPDAIEPTYAIDLPTALRLAETKNPAIAIAREAICENLALQQQADAMLLPTLAAGGNLHVHRGPLAARHGRDTER